MNQIYSCYVLIFENNLISNINYFQRMIEKWLHSQRIKHSSSLKSKQHSKKYIKAISHEDIIRLVSQQKEVKRKIKNFQSLYWPSSQNINQIKVKSAFYTKCTKKGKCQCQFHKYQRHKLDNHNFNWKNRITKKKYRQFKSEAFEQANPNRIKALRTEGNQLVKNFGVVKNQSVDPLDLKSSKMISNNFKSQKQKYESIAFKVQCRNQQFQQFLKNNELYILKKSSVVGKNNYSCFEEETCDELLKKILSKNEQNDEKLNERTSEQQKSGHFKRNLKAKKTLGYIKPLKRNSKYITQQQLQKIGILVNAIVNKKKHISKIQLLGLMNYLQDCFQTEFQQNGNNPVSRKIKKYLQSLQKFNLLLSNEDGLNSLAKNRFFSQGKNQKWQLQNKKQKSEFEKQNLNSESNFQDPTQQADVVKLQQQNRLTQRIQTQSSTQNIDSDQNRQKKQQIFNLKKKKIMLAHSSGKKKGGINQMKKNFSKFSVIMKSQLMQSLKKQERDMTKLSQDQLMSTMESGGIMYNTMEMINSNRHKQKIMKKNKKKMIEQHLREREQQQKNNVQFLKMKRHIERNRHFIRKMEKKMHDFDLDIFIINTQDSLITQKKKMRFLKQMLAQTKCNENKKNQIYQELANYIEIYRQHCNLILQRQRNQDICQNEEVQLVQEGALISTKDMNASLKFINLKENQQREKQKNMENWIAIPQFITTDLARLRKSKKRLQSLHYIDSCPSELEQDEVGSVNSLIQVEMKNNCQTFEQNEQVRQIEVEQRKDIKAPNQKMSNFQAKIDLFRKKLIAKLI